MALQAVDLGANKEEEEALYKTVMVTDHRGQRNTLIGLDFKARSDREEAREETDERAEHFVDSLAPAGGPKFWTEGRLSVCRNLGEAKREFFCCFCGSSYSPVPVLLSRHSVAKVGRFSATRGLQRGTWVALKGSLSRMSSLKPKEQTLN